MSYQVLRPLLPTGLDNSFLHVLPTSTDGEMTRPPALCIAFLIAVFPLVALLIAYTLFGEYRKSVAKSLPVIERRRRSKIVLAASRRGSLLTSGGDDDEQQDGLQYSTFGSMIYYALRIQVLLMHLTLSLFALVLGFYDYKVAPLINLGSLLMTQFRSSSSTNYSWDTICLAFLVCFFPCVLLTLWVVIGDSYLRVRLLLPAALKDADLVNIVRRTAYENNMMPEDTAIISKSIHVFVDACFRLCGVERQFVRVVVPVQQMADMRFIELHGLRYTWDHGLQSFAATQTSPSHNLRDLHRRVEAGGLPKDEVQARCELMGSNIIEVSVPSRLEAFFNEISSLGYLYQGFFLYLWCSAGALKNALIWLAVFVISALWKALTMRYNRFVLEDAASSFLKSSHRVLRSGQWLDLPSSAIVAGDVIGFPKSGEILPVDAYLLEGHLLLDESVLTGEATPVQKFPLSGVGSAVEANKGDKKHYLFAGTRLMQGDSSSYAVVTDTGVCTVRGKLLMQMLYPNPVWLQFEEDYKLMCFASLLFGALSCFSILQRRGMDATTVVQALFCIFNTFSPLLPVSLVMCQSQAAARLRMEQGIICLTPSRIVAAGRADIVCFDKTGTLTEDGLEMLGCIPVSLNRFKVGDRLVELAVSGEGLVLASAICHSLATHGSGAELTGPQVEMAMFRKSGASVVSPEKQAAVGPVRHVKLPSGHTVEAEEKFPFDHHSMTMSVVLNSTHQLKIGSMPPSSRVALTKGAPENVANLCVQTPMDDPVFSPLSVSRLLEASEALSRDGCYVLMVAGRTLEGEVMPARQDIEVAASLQPLGLLVFRNNLRAESPALIKTLRAGNLKVVVISGDSHYTAAAMAAEAGILEQRSTLYSEVVDSTVEWRTAAVEIGLPTDETCQLVVSGNAWAILHASGDVHEWLPQARVFGRISPEQKAQIVNTYISAGHTAMFVGDGGNDSAALRVAHVGLALTETKPDAVEQACSVIAHFNTTTKTPTAVLHTLQEGRCNLATIFGCFVFLFTYGLMLNFCKTVQNWNPGGPLHFSGWQMIFSEGIILPSLIYAMVRSRPQTRLSSSRPAWSIVGKQGGLSLVVFFIFNAVTVLVMLNLLYVQEWFIPFNAAAKHVEEHQIWSWGDNWETESMFIMFSSGLLATAYANSFGGDFRLPVYLNLDLNGMVVMTLMILLTLTWAQGTFVNCLFRINCDSVNLKSWRARTDLLVAFEAAEVESRGYYGMGPHNGNMMPASWQTSITCGILAIFSICCLLQKIIVEVAGS